MFTLQCTSPKTFCFYGENLDDLALMPTTTKIGEGEYPHALAPVGSYALILTASELKTFMLRSTGWVDVTVESGGGDTDNYNDLKNKPQINGITLVDNIALSTISNSPSPGQTKPDDSRAEIDELFN